MITIKNIQMLAVIEEHNRTLEQKILERTAQLHQKTNDVNNMLQNMQQGIFTILPGQVIHPEHSVYLNRIFETDQAANRQVLSLLFEDSDVGSDTISQMSAALDSMIGEDPLMFDLNAHLLIDEYTKYFPNGRSKILELDWNSVMGANDVIDPQGVARQVWRIPEIVLRIHRGKPFADRKPFGQEPRCDRRLVP